MLKRKIKNLTLSDLKDVTEVATNPFERIEKVLIVSPNSSRSFDPNDPVSLVTSDAYGIIGVSSAVWGNMTTSTF